MLLSFGTNKGVPFKNLLWRKSKQTTASNVLIHSQLLLLLSLERED